MREQFSTTPAKSKREIETQTQTSSYNLEDAAAEAASEPSTPSEVHPYAGNEEQQPQKERKTTSSSGREAREQQGYSSKITHQHT